MVSWPRICASKKSGVRGKNGLGIRGMAKVCVQRDQGAAELGLSKFCLRRGLSEIQSWMFKRSPMPYPRVPFQVSRNYIYCLFSAVGFSFWGSQEKSVPGLALKDIFLGLQLL